MTSTTLVRIQAADSPGIQTYAAVHAGASVHLLAEAFGFGDAETLP